MKKLCLLGGHWDTYDKAPFKDDDFEIWSVGSNWNRPGAEYVNVWFELHKPDAWQASKEFLQTRSRVIMRKVYKEIPGSEAFPREIISNYRKYFESTFAYMAALALEREWKEIHIYGFHCSSDNEYATQKPNVEYFIGLADGRGVNVVIPQGCPLVRSTNLYTLESIPENVEILQRNIKHFNAQKNELQNALLSNQRNMSRLDGAIEVCESMLRRLKGD